MYSIACTGAILWSLLNCTHGWKLYLQFSMFTFGVYSSRVYAATLALSLACAVTYPSAYVERLKPYFLVSGIIIPLLLVGIQLLTLQVFNMDTVSFFLTSNSIRKYGKEINPFSMYSNNCFTERDQPSWR